MLGSLDQMGIRHAPFVQRENTKIRMDHPLAKLAQAIQRHPWALKTLQIASAWLDFMISIPQAPCTASPAPSTTLPSAVVIISQLVFAMWDTPVRAAAHALPAGLAHTRISQEPPHALIV
jgi:hypothetical protein